MHHAIKHLLVEIYNHAEENFLPLAFSSATSLLLVMSNHWTIDYGLDYWIELMD